MGGGFFTNGSFINGNPTNNHCGYGFRQGGNGGVISSVGNGIGGGFGGGGSSDGGAGAGGGYSGGGGGDYASVGAGQSYLSGGAGSYNIGTNPVNTEKYNFGDGKVNIIKIA